MIGIHFGTQGGPITVRSPEQFPEPQKWKCVVSEDRPSLDELGREHGTDKASGAHDYLRIYELFLAPMRDKSMVVFEMGVGGGGSLKMWQAYFPSAFIFGMDIDSSKQEYGNANRIAISIGDQRNEGDLDRACPFPIGVACDDASHDPGHQLFAYKRLIPHMMPGGVYILEDIGSGEVSDFLARLAGHCIRDTWGNDEDEWVREHGPKIEMIALYKETSITRMKSAA